MVRKIDERKKVTKRRYTREQKQQAAIEYAIRGSYTQVGLHLDIPIETIQGWSKHFDGWDAIITKVHHEKEAEHRANYSKIIDLAQQVTLDKLPEATAAQAHLVSCQATDKTRLIDNRPTSISSNAGSQDAIKGLIEQFKKVSRENRDITAVKTTYTEVDKPKDK